MKNKNKIVYRIIERKTGRHQGVYSRAYDNDYDFDSVDAARNSHCWDIYQDKKKYKISKYKISYKLITNDCK